MAHNVPNSAADLLKKISEATEAIQQVSEKLDGLLEPAGAGYRFTEEALEQSHPWSDSPDYPDASPIPGDPVSFRADLLLSMEEYATIACMDGRVFGVTTANERCDFSLNPCIRDYLRRALANNQALVERELGYDIIAKYHVDEIEWDGRERIQLENRGIAALNVTKKSVKIGNFVVPPYIIEDVPLEELDGRCVIRVSMDMVDNPGLIMVRNSSGVIIDSQSGSGFPKRENGEWVIWLEAQYVDGATVDIQHSNYMCLETDAPSCAGVLVATLPSRPSETVSFAKPVETLENDKIRLWFRPWSLIDFGFRADEEINLLDMEFHKLTDTIDLYCVSDYLTPPRTASRQEGCCGSEDGDVVYATDMVEATLLYADRGIVMLKKTDKWDARCSTPIKIQIAYRTDPALMNVPTDTLKEAIAYLTSAEAPLNSCGCTVSSGLIFEAQQAYTDVRFNPVTGETKANLKYGNLHGQLVFAERLAKVKSARKTIRI